MLVISALPFNGEATNEQSDENAYQEYEVSLNCARTVGQTDA